MDIQNSAVNNSAMVHNHRKSNMQAAVPDRMSNKCPVPMAVYNSTFQSQHPNMLSMNRREHACVIRQHCMHSMHPIDPNSSTIPLHSSLLHLHRRCRMPTMSTDH
jgi:hypothetical protein